MKKKICDKAFCLGKNFHIIGPKRRGEKEREREREREREEGKSL